jgi:flagellar FliL protein
MSNSAPARPAAAVAAAGAEVVEETPPKRKKPLVLYGAVGLVLAALMATGGWMLGPRLLGWPRSAPAEAKREAPVKVTVPLGAVVVNLGPPASRRYLKIGVELGVPGARESKEVEEKKPQITDLLITVLSTTPVEALGTEDGRVALKKALIARIQEELRLEKVSRVYFTEFVIQ